MRRFVAQPLRSGIAAVAPFRHASTKNSDVRNPPATPPRANTALSQFEERALRTVTSRFVRLFPASSLTALGGAEKAISAFGSGSLVPFFVVHRSRNAQLQDVISALHLGSRQVLKCTGATQATTELNAFLDRLAPMRTVAVIPLDNASTSLCEAVCRARKGAGVTHSIEAFVRAIKSPAQATELLNHPQLFRIGAAPDLLVHLSRCNPEWDKLDLAKARATVVPTAGELQRQRQQQQQQRGASPIASERAASPVRQETIKYLKEIFRNVDRTNAEVAAASALIRESAVLVAVPVRDRPGAELTGVKLFFGPSASASLEPIGSVSEALARVEAARPVLLVTWDAKELLRARLPVIDMAAVCSADTVRRFGVWCVKYAAYLMAGQSRTPTAALAGASTAVLSDAQAAANAEAIRGHFCNQVAEAAACSMACGLRVRMRSLIATSLMEANGLQVCSAPEQASLRREMTDELQAAKKELDAIAAATLHDLPRGIANKWSWQVSRNIASLVFGGCFATAVGAEMAADSSSGESINLERSLFKTRELLRRDSLLLQTRLTFIAAAAMPATNAHARNEFVDGALKAKGVPPPAGQSGWTLKALIDALCPTPPSKGEDPEVQLQRLAKAAADATIIYNVRLQVYMTDDTVPIPRVLQVFRCNDDMAAHVVPIFDCRVVVNNCIIKPKELPWSIAIDHCVKKVAVDIVEAAAVEAALFPPIVILSGDGRAGTFLVTERFRIGLGLPVAYIPAAALQRPSTTLEDDFAALAKPLELGEVVSNTPQGGKQSTLAMLGNNAHDTLNLLDSSIMMNGKKLSWHPACRSGVLGLASSSLLSDTDVDELRTKCREGGEEVLINKSTLSLIEDAARRALDHRATKPHDGTAAELEAFEARVRHTKLLKRLPSLLSAFRSLERDIQMMPVNGVTKSFKIGGDGRIHHFLEHTGTSTGRLSSHNPNAQAIPKTKVRKMFVSRFGREHGSIIEADYSQLEVVVLAALSRDPQMLADLSNSIDFHCKRVTMIRPDLTYEEVVHRAKVLREPEFVELRQSAKTFSFQRQYGAGSRAIAESSGLPLATVEAMIAAEDRIYRGASRYFDIAYDCLMNGKNYFATDPELALEPKSPLVSLPPELVNPTVLRAPLDQTCFPTLSGARYSLSTAVSSAGRRAPALLNYPVQGFAGELMLLALGNVYEQLAARNFFDGRAVLINTVHDCVWVDAHNDAVPQVVTLLREVLESIPALAKEVWPTIDMSGIKFPVSISAGPTLFDQAEVPSPSPSS